MAINDSIDIDKSYLTLLPQPFSAAIAKRFSERFGGRSFLNQQASKSIFTKTANEHKIIHISTHAESNNVNPELSRLVFAKNISDSTLINDNYLYTYEIYNQNLNSNLAILSFKKCKIGLFKSSRGKDDSSAILGWFYFNGRHPAYKAIPFCQLLLVFRYRLIISVGCFLDN